MKKSQKQITLLIVFAVLITIVAFVIVFIRPDPITRPVHQLTTADVQAGDSSALSGHVAYNSYPACLEEDASEVCDEAYPHFINLQTADELVTIFYNAKSGEVCNNPGAASQGKRAALRSPVEVFAHVTEQGTLSTCPSAEYYVQPIAR